MLKKQILLLLLAVTITTVSCRKDKVEPQTNPTQNTPDPDPEPEPEPEKDINTIPEFYKPAKKDDYGKNAPDLFLIANYTHKISQPYDLDFHTSPTRENELWVINHGTENTGGSTVTITAAGTPDQQAIRLQDGNAWHFMSLPTALAFSNNGNWATSNGVLSANHDGGTYTGPTLWSSDMNIYAKPSGGNGSHLDMIHQSPYTMGIAAESDNIFWVFDGYNGNIVRYDFVHDHGPGMDDHSDGIVRRYTEAKVTKADIPSHIILDKASGWLYVVSTTDGKIYRLNTNSGTLYKYLNPNYQEPLQEYSEFRNTTWEVFVTTGLSKACGIDINDNRLFVSDYATGDIVAYDLESKTELGRISTGKKGVMGIKVGGTDNKLWFVNSETNEVYRIDPK